MIKKTALFLTATYIVFNSYAGVPNAYNKCPFIADPTQPAPMDGNLPCSISGIDSNGSTLLQVPGKAGDTISFSLTFTASPNNTAPTNFGLTYYTGCNLSTGPVVHQIGPIQLPPKGILTQQITTNCTFDWITTNNLLPWAAWGSVNIYQPTAKEERIFTISAP